MIMLNIVTIIMSIMTVIGFLVTIVEVIVIATVIVLQRLALVLLMSIRWISNCDGRDLQGKESRNSNFRLHGLLDVDCLN